MSGASGLTYADLLQLLQARRSIRLFSDRPVARPILEQWLEAARWAPSNHNRQPWKFVVWDDCREIKALAFKVQEAIEQELQHLPTIAAEFRGELIEHATFFGAAPVVVLAMHKQTSNVAASVVGTGAQSALISGEPLSVAMAVENLLLAAVTLELGTCVLTAPLIARGVFDAIRGRYPGFDVTCLIAVGHPAEVPQAPRRKNLELLFEYWNS